MKTVVLSALLLGVASLLVPTRATPAVAFDLQADLRGAEAPVIRRLPDQSHLLFFELPLFASSASTVVQFRFDIHGDLFLTETVALKEPQAELDEAQGVELLSGKPSQLDELYRRAAAGDDVQVHVSLNGRPLDDFSWAELTARSASLVLQGFRPLDVRSEVREGEASRGSGLRHLSARIDTPQACAPRACDNAFLSCLSACDSRPIPNCETNCDTRHTNCLTVCGCPIVLSTDTTTTVIGYSDTGQKVCLQPLGGVALNYEKLNVINKVTQTVNTEGCDGLFYGSTTVTYQITCCCYRALQGGCGPAGGPPSCITQ